MKPGTRVRFNRGDSIQEDVVVAEFMQQIRFTPQDTPYDTPAVVLKGHSWCYVTDIVEVLEEPSEPDRRDKILEERGIGVSELTSALANIRDFLMGDVEDCDDQWCIDLIQYCIGGKRYDIKTLKHLDWDPGTSFDKFVGLDDDE